MADEDGKVSLELLGQMLQRLTADMADVKQSLADQSKSSENIDATVTRLHADVVDAKATGKEVAVRLTLVEHRMGGMQTSMDRIHDDVEAIKKHVGLVKA